MVDEHGIHKKYWHHTKHWHHTGHTSTSKHEHHTEQAAPAVHTDHSDHSDHRAGAAHHPPASWRTAITATLHCLTGCAIGEVLGMVIGTALGWNNAATMALAIVLAFAFGYGLTMLGLIRAGVAFGAALSVALAADTISITVMEIVDNAVLLVVPGAMHAGLTEALFWGALAIAFAVAFVITTPVNKWLIGRGRGHAVVHAFHGH